MKLSSAAIFLSCLVSSVSFAGDSLENESANMKHIYFSGIESEFGNLNEVSDNYSLNADVSCPASGYQKKVVLSKVKNKIKVKSNENCSIVITSFYNKNTTYNSLNKRTTINVDAQGNMTSNYDMLNGYFYPNFPNLDGDFIINAFVIDKNHFVLKYVIMIS